MKLFISQPMRGKSDTEILRKRNEIIEEMRAQFGEDVEVIQSFIPCEGAPDGSNAALWYLGRSFQFLAQADIAYFAEGWEDARGCQMEHLAACKYGIKNIITESHPVLESAT